MRNLKSRILTVDLYLSDEEYAYLKNWLKSRDAPELQKF